MRFKIVCPVKISGYQGETVTLYKNTKGLYIAILKGVEVGLASELESDIDIELPSCIDCVVTNSFKNELQFTVKAIK